MHFLTARGRETLRWHHPAKTALAGGEGPLQGQPEADTWILLQVLVRFLLISQRHYTVEVLICVT